MAVKHRNQRLRIIVWGDNPISFDTTRKEIEEGVGCFTKFNEALQLALAELDSLEALGISRNIQGFGLQIDFK